MAKLNLDYKELALLKNLLEALTIKGTDAVFIASIIQKINIGLESDKPKDSSEKQLIVENK